MRWVAPTEKDTANQTLEKRLWAAADQFRANSALKAQACGFGDIAVGDALRGRQRRAHVG